MTALWSIVAALAAAAAALALLTWRTARRVTTALPPQGRLVDAGGVRFHICERGSGPTILLIHGLAGQMGHFTYAVAARLARDFHVVAIDRPGSGYSRRLPSMDADPAAQAAAIGALLDTLPLARVVVVGHSLGGAVALALALARPRQVAGLALLAPLTHLVPGAAAPAAFRLLALRPAALRWLFAWTLALPLAVLGRRAVLTQVFGPDAPPRDFPTRAGGLLSLRPSHFIAACIDLQALPAAMPRLAARYAELGLPVSVLFGRDDRILDWRSNGQALVDKVRGAELTLIDGGHMLPVSHADVSARFIAAAAARAMRSAP